MDQNMIQKTKALSSQARSMGMEEIANDLDAVVLKMEAEATSASNTLASTLTPDQRIYWDRVVALAGPIPNEF